MRFRSLDAVRGLAALLVVLVHLTAAGFFYDVPFVRHGGLAVPLFFVLSGFVMAHTYQTRISSTESFKSFIIRRFGRIYPLHALTLSTLVLLEFMKLVLVAKGVPSGQSPFSDSNSLTSLVANILLLQAVIPFGDYTWNGPSWSLSVEFFTYLIFGLTILIWAKRASSVILLLWILSGAALLFIDTWEIALHLTSGRGLLQCVFGFMSGVLLYAAFKSTKETIVQHAASLELLGALLIVSIFWFAPFNDFGTILAFAAVILSLSSDRGPVSRLLHSFPLQFLGMISLSLYLTHFVILSVLNGVIRAAQSIFEVTLLRNGNVIDFGPAGTMDALALVYLATVVVVSTVTFVFIEEPFRLYFNNLSKGMSARYSPSAGLLEISRLRKERSTA